MTRAALLHLLAAPESLSAAAVQDLEQLAQAFPYCQTAHVLLAKAAHDQGSMLAGQRLRRAATYATDRQLLRQLLERPAQFPTPPPPPNPALPAPSPEAAAPEVAVEPIAAAIPEPELLPTPELAVSETTAEAAAAEIEEPASTAPASTREAALVAEVEAATIEALAAPVTSAEPEPLPEEVAEPTPPTSLPGAASPELPTPAAADKLPPATELKVPAEPTGPIEPSGELLPVAAAEGVTGQGITVEEVAVKEAVVETPVLAATITIPTTLDQLSPAAIDATAEPDPAPLPIRPPAEVGVARFEFGLSSDSVLEAGFSGYQLAEAGAAEPLAAPANQPVPPQVPAFTGAADLAYALSGGSRLGYAMQPAFALAADSLPPPALPTVETPGSLLPPAGEFFAPDALLLEHLASQPPPAPAAPSSLELIDSFLRRAPQRRRGIVTLLTVPEQADLSLRSTRAEPDLASESLARILAGQGKTERAIAVYERLMVRQPEKSAYFAVQIDLLRNPPTPS